MKASVAFIFFMLFLAGIAFVNLRGMQEQSVPQDVAETFLVASAWRPVKLNDMPVSAETLMSVQFASDQQISGHSGCNRYFGSYELNGQVLTISPLGATRMACPEPAASLEIAFLEALQSVATAALVNSHLVLSNDTGAAVVHLRALQPAE